MNAVWISALQKLLEEIEKNKVKCDECQKYAKDYIDTIKVNAFTWIFTWILYEIMLRSYSILRSIYLFQDYELQLVAYRAQVEPLASPLKKTKMESASDNIIQEVSGL